jgi:transcriptional regulator with XRE-family HTH domain
VNTVVVIAIWELFLPNHGRHDADLAFLGQAVRRTREQQGMSADEFAADTGISRKRIDALEAGHLDPTYDLLLVLAKGLAIRPFALLTLAEQLKESSEP